MEHDDTLAVTQPVYLEPHLFCVACGARFRADCMCVAPVNYDVPVAELDL